jgi:hypothetical protein
MNRAKHLLAARERRAVANKTLSRVTANFQAVQPQTRTMEGREYLVVPMVMITNGVHTGSKGELNYPEEELSKTPEAWNMKPVVVYHPVINGVGVSACDPEIVDAYKIGLIMNTRYDEGALRAEAWIEAERASLVDNRVLAGVQNGEMMEVSTGLFTDNKDENGAIVARNYRPDHLAILPDQVGACSIADGAGLCRNQAEDRLAELLGKLEERLGKPSAEAAMGLFSEGTLALNELTHDATRTGLRQALEVKFPGQEVWVEDVFDDRVVYEQGGSLWQLDYTIENDLVKLDGSPVRVARVVSYEEVGPLVGNTSENPTHKGVPMTAKEIVDGLIANDATHWEETDREHLMAFDAAKLEKLVPTANKDPDPATAVANAAKEGAKELEPAPAATPATPATPAANALTPQQEADLAFAASVRKERRDGAIATITGNAQNKLTAEQLADLPDATLAAMAASVAPAAQASDPTANYGGQGSPPADADPTGNTASGEPLALPTMNFDPADAE